MATSDVAADYGEEELLERLRNFDSDSPYEIGLIAAAVKRIEELEQRIENMEFEMRYPDDDA